MNTYKEKVESFLNCKNIAVAGVSRKPGTSVGNPIYKKFKNAGYNTFQINPNTDEIEGDVCYPDIKSISQLVDAVMICTNPNDSLNVVKECIKMGIKNIWFHKTLGMGSYSSEAVEYCRNKGINVIENGCPMMHIAPIDFGHKCIHFTLNLFGKLNK